MIRFPKMHIAESVVNRILNAVDGIDDAEAAFSMPSIPDQDPKSAELDARLAAPAPNAAPNESVIEGAIAGESPLESLVKE